MNPWWLRPPGDDQTEVEPGRKSGKAGPKPESVDSEAKQPSRPARAAKSNGRSNGRSKRSRSTKTKPRSGGEQRDRRIGLFSDVENIALALREDGSTDLDIQKVVRGLLQQGSLVVRRAYADWHRFRDLKRRYHDCGFELIDIPRKDHSGKSSADIKLAVDAIELSFSKQHVDTFALLSGDADLCPLVAKLRENGKTVIGIGPERSASKNLVDCCDQYLYPNAFQESSALGNRAGELTPERHEAFAMMVAALRSLTAENKDRIWGSLVKQTIQREEPSFSEGAYGYSAFSDLLEDAARCNIIRLERDDRSGSYVVTDFREL